MHFIQSTAAHVLTIMAFIAMASADVMGNDWSNAGKCASKNADANAAIEAFCSKGDIIIPSDYAKNGVNVGGMVAKVNGDCGWQWLPPVWCRAQFHAVCAQGGQHGGGYRQFNGCQNFHIMRVKYN